MASAVPAGLWEEPDVVGDIGDLAERLDGHGPACGK